MKKYNYQITCIDYPLCRGVGLLLAHNSKKQPIERQKKQSVPLVTKDKYVGEQDANELAEALLNPETRNVAQLTVSDVKEAANLIECLLGPSVPPRRDYLLKHSEEANDDI